MPPSKSSPEQPAAPADSYRNIPLLNILRSRIGGSFWKS